MLRSLRAIVPSHRQVTTAAILPDYILIAATNINKKTTTTKKQGINQGYGGLGGRTNSTQLYDLSNVKSKTIK